MHGGELPDGSDCPTYCNECIPPDLDIGDERVQTWQVSSNGWVSVPICSVCKTSITIVVDGSVKERKS